MRYEWRLCQHQRGAFGSGRKSIFREHQVGVEQSSSQYESDGNHDRGHDRGRKERAELTRAVSLTVAIV